jgi:hypothetical protein
MEEIKKDVSGESSAPAPEAREVETPAEGGDDKDNNFKALRAQIAEKDAEIARLQSLSDSKERSLSEDHEELEKAPEVKKESDSLTVLFSRDKKEATLQWNSEHNVSNEEWSEIQKRVSLKGDETVSEIKRKIDDAYYSIPSVREQREKELFEKGKKEAMRQLSDEEMDTGFGGGDVDLGDGRQVRHNGATKAFAKSFGLSEEDLKNIDTEGNPNQWKEGKEAKRSFFG